LIVLLVIVWAGTSIITGDTHQSARLLGSSIGFIVLSFIGLIAIFYNPNQHLTDKI
jgi:hypothetical protein